jgi:lipopolysaccharide transport system ATP-binding protein
LSISGDVAISVKNLSKRYLIGHESRPGGYQTFREAVANGVKGVGRKAMAMFRGQQLLAGDEVEEFWALKDVSFEIKRGEVLGVIGRNGAGKSTLLKVLSRITEPSEGRVEIHGRVASLLEVGTGFHPELTGRENVFLNGAILGMSKREIRTKFDEIVAFAEVEKFLDTPVKRYSSGMYVRLAFAVAAHLDPEILVVDEVLAVGDAEFQKKCLGKMGELSRQDSRTILLVSHNMHAIQSLCSSAILLSQGRLVFDGKTADAVREYQATAKVANVADFDGDESRPSIRQVFVDPDELDRGNLVVEIHFKSPFPLSPPIGGIVLSSEDGLPVFGSNPKFHPAGFKPEARSEGVLRVTVNQMPLHGGTYFLSVWLGEWNKDHQEKRNILAIHFKSGSRHAHAPGPAVIGYANADARWELTSDPANS